MNNLGTLGRFEANMLNLINLASYIIVTDTAEYFLDLAINNQLQKKVLRIKLDTSIYAYFYFYNTLSRVFSTSFGPKIKC